MEKLFRYIIFLLGLFLVQINSLTAQSDKRERDTLKVSSYVEGPHIRYVTSRKLEVYYIQHDSLKNSTEVVCKFFRFKSDSLLFKGFAGKDTSIYVIPRKIKPEKGIYEMPNRVVVVGDVHGEFDDLKKILQNNAVIDTKGKWIFGTGHLVFTGDIFDRGDKVTECLWMIFKLEQQAKKQGGRVHYILGNHESMVMLYDDRYVADKYRHASRFLKKHYAELFDKHSVFGIWLRTKNALIRIGNQMFVHGGISPRLLEKKWSIKEINTKLRYHLNHYDALKDTSFVDLILFQESPLWYRGYLVKTPLYNRMSYRKVLETLQFYGAMSIIFGHTPVSKIHPFYSFRLIAMDVPIGNSKYVYQGLLIENQKYYRIFVDRKKERLK